VRILEHLLTHSDNMPPPVPDYLSTCDALPWGGGFGIRHEAFSHPFW